MQQQQQPQLESPVVVVGAGAAGLMAAIFASRGGARVLLLETRRQPGAKIRVSGGSRCNVLPSQADLEDFHTSGSLHSLRNVLFSWPLAEVRAFFEDALGVPLKTEATGKVFPRSDKSRDIVDALLRELQRQGVTLRGDARVTDLRRDAAGAWALRLHDGSEVRAQALVMATGGLSLPKTGSDGAGWRLARGVGHSVVPTYPALVPLLTQDTQLQGLAGVALPVRLTAQRGSTALKTYAGDFLFTHHGFSGPAVLNVSRFLAAPEGHDARVLAAWGDPARSWPELLHDAQRKRVGACVREHLPRRLADVLVLRAGVSEDRPVGELRRPERARLLAQLSACPLPVSGNEGYRTAEITAGGVPLGEVHTRSLESRKAPGLFLAGEMLDVVGKLGGYNFLWAWNSGRRAGMAAAECVKSVTSSPPLAAPG